MSYGTARMQVYTHELCTCEYLEEHSHSKCKSSANCSWIYHLSRVKLCSWSHMNREWNIATLELYSSSVVLFESCLSIVSRSSFTCQRLATVVACKCLLSHFVLNVHLVKFVDCCDIVLRCHGWTCRLEEESLLWNCSMDYQWIISRSA